MSRRAIVLAGVAATLLAACATEVEPVVVPRPQAVRTEVTREIEEGRPEQALQRISALRHSEVLPKGELDELFDRAVRRMQSAYERALADGRPLDAARLRGNLVSVSALEPDPAFVSGLHLEAAEAFEREGNLPAALTILLDAPELSSLPVEALERAVRAAVSLNNRYAARILLEILGPAWRSDHPDVVAFVDGAAGAVEMSTGVVTVWVNRGLRLESGVGIPDRVIGSGFFIDPRGFIVTNYHVIASEVDPEYEGYSRLYVRLPADPATRIPARVVGYSRGFDVALLKAEVDAPYVFSFTDIRSLEPGTRILAIGSPGGLENSISSGIISAVGRRFLQMGDAMQVDVPINPGNSGGPLLDADGNLVGIVFAGIEQFEGVNFAIPSHWIRRFLPDLFEAGRVVHPWMGVAVEPVQSGLEVVYVAHGSSAALAGLQTGDVITEIAGWPAERIGPAQGVVLRHEVGSILPIQWSREGADLSGIVVLEERPESPVEIALERDVRERLFPVLFGMRVERVGGFALRQDYQVTQVYRGSLADETGITPGDLFTERGFEFDDDLDAVFLRIFIRKRTEGFLQTSIQLPAFVERDNFL